MTRLKRQRGGRPSLFDPGEDRASIIELAKEMSLGGATHEEIWKEIGVDERTFYRWYNLNEEFRGAVKIGGREADERVKNTLFRRAVNGESDTAIIFWLKNRDPNNWRDKRDVDLGGSVEITDNTNRQLALAALALIRTAVEDVHDEAITIEHQDAAE
jgi:hypothetical protein